MIATPVVPPTVVTHVTFAQPVRILGTSQTVTDFDVSEGWLIEVHAHGVTLSRTASQNIPEVPAFSIFGVGYSIPAPVKLEEETIAILAEPSPAAKFVSQQQRGKR
jgi:hypothetical protein